MGVPRMTPAEIQAHNARVRGQPVPARDPRSVERSQHEIALERQMQASDVIPQTWETELQIVPGRRFRTDFAWRNERVALEVHGLIRSGGGSHQSSDGMSDDCIKALRLAVLGWTPVAVTPKLIASGEAIELLERLFARIAMERGPC